MCRSISGFTLPSIHHNNSPLLYVVSYLWNFRHRLVRYYWYSLLSVETEDWSDLRSRYFGSQWTRFRQKKTMWIDLTMFPWGKLFKNSHCFAIRSFDGTVGSKRARVTVQIRYSANPFGVSCGQVQKVQKIVEAWFWSRHRQMKADVASIKWTGMPGSLRLMVQRMGSWCPKFFQEYIGSTRLRLCRASAKAKMPLSILFTLLPGLVQLFAVGSHSQVKFLNAHNNSSNWHRLPWKGHGQFILGLAEFTVGWCGNR